jgi:hypothetical protein
VGPLTVASYIYLAELEVGAVVDFVDFFPLVGGGEQGSFACGSRHFLCLLVSFPLFWMFQVSDCSPRLQIYKRGTGGEGEGVSGGVKCCPNVCVNCSPYLGNHGRRLRGK